MENHHVQIGISTISMPSFAILTANHGVIPERWRIFSATKSHPGDQKTDHPDLGPRSPATFSLRSGSDGKVESKLKASKSSLTSRVKQSAVAGTFPTYKTKKIKKIRMNSNWNSLTQWCSLKLLIHQLHQLMTFEPPNSCRTSECFPASTRCSRHLRRGAVFAPNRWTASSCRAGVLWLKIMEML